jgi:hypothetical protein
MPEERTHPKHQQVWQDAKRNCPAAYDTGDGCLYALLLPDVEIKSCDKKGEADEEKKRGEHVPSSLSRLSVYYQAFARVKMPLALNVKVNVFPAVAVTSAGESSSRM